MAQPTPETRALRRRLRAIRHAVPPRERRIAGRSIANSLRRLRVFRPGARIAVYLAMPDEVDLSAAIAAARASGARIYVPRITGRRRRELTFVPLEAHAVLRTSFFGIAEPATPARNGIEPLHLDAILLPLVGFDRNGNRLGMGAGYYDRALGHLRDAARRWRRPRLIGIALACQESEGIVPGPWDVPLDHVVTEHGVIDTRRGRAAGPTGS